FSALGCWLTQQKPLVESINRARLPRTRTSSSTMAMLIGISLFAVIREPFFAGVKTSAGFLFRKAVLLYHDCQLDFRPLLRRAADGARPADLFHPPGEIRQSVAGGNPGGIGRRCARRKSASVVLDDEAERRRLDLQLEGNLRRSGMLERVVERLPDGQ